MRNLSKDKAIPIGSLVCVPVLLLLILAMPEEMGRVKFFMALLIPIALSYEYFDVEFNLLKRCLLLTGAYVIFNLIVFQIHVWQLIWEESNPNGLFGFQIKLDRWLSEIPYNDGMWLRQFSTPVLDSFFVTIYEHGFILCLLSLVIFYMLSGQPNKIIVAIFAGHIMQYLLILPFHFWVDGHQVWYIQNLYYGTNFSDPIEGFRTTVPPIVPSLNHVFPSMHTSIATVAIILAWREKAKIIKYPYAILNVFIIISTVYLGIHWVIDIFAGILFGFVSLKLADKLAVVDWKQKWQALRPVNKKYEREFEQSS